MLKRLTTLILTFILILPVGVSGNDTEDLNYYYIPLRDVFESNEGSVSWNELNSNIYIEQGVDTYNYFEKQDHYIKNNDEIKLQYPLRNLNGVMKIHYNDIKFLYETENDTYKETKKSIVAMVYTLLEANEIPGITLSFVDSKTNYIWEQGFGKADIETSAPVTKNTMYNIGSISKTFTALGILKLIEEGNFSLDDKILDILPEFSLKTNPVYGGNYEDVTVEMLLSHYSGINGDNINTFYTINGYDEKYMNDYMKNNESQYMTSVSGTRMSYSNSAYAILGNIIGKYSEKNVFDGYIENINKWIINPLALQNTKVVPQEMDIVASSYKDNKTLKQTPFYVNNISAGGMYSSSQDMSKFMLFLLNEGFYNDEMIYKPDTINDLMTPVSFKDPLNSSLNMALGTYEVSYNNIIYTGHGGDVEYFHSDFALSPATGQGIFVSANSASSAGVMNGISILNLEQAIIESKRAPRSDNPSAGGIQSPIKDLKDYMGYYLELGESVLKENNNIEFPLTNTEFINNGENIFKIKDVDFEYKLTTVDNIDVFVVYDTHIISQKVEIGKVDDDFKKLVGNYKPVLTQNEKPLFHGLTIFEQNGNTCVIAEVLSVDVLMKMILPLLKIDDDTYVVTGVGRNLSNVIEVLKIDDNTYLNYNGSLFELEK